MPTEINVRANIEAGKYNNKLPYVPIPRVPRELRLSASQMIGPELEAIPAIKKQYEADKAAAVAAGEPHRKETQQLMTMFEEDCAKACGLENHPKRNKLFAKAWDLGHANGLGEVWHYYEELSELLQD